MRTSWLCAVALLGAACDRGGRKVEPQASTPAAPTPWPAGPTRGKQATITGVLLFSSAPKVDPQLALEGACKKEAALVAAPATHELTRGEREGFPLAPERMHSGLAKGPTEPEVHTLSTSALPAWRLRVTAPPAGAAAALRAATMLEVCLARTTGAFLWDPQSRNLFTAERLRDQRLADWTDPAALDVRAHVSAIEYDVNGLVRMGTVGLEKLGVPDVVMNGVAPNLVADMNILLNAAAQTVADGTPLQTAGELRVDLSRFRSESWYHQLGAIKAQRGTGAITLRVVEGRRDPRDPDNRLLEIRFDVPGAGSPTEQQGQALVSFVGAKKDDAVAFEDDAEILAAKARARVELARLQPRWDKGLRATESLIVKAPFRTDDGNGIEWMWVHVTSWKKRLIRGTLDNAPEEVSQLHLGSMVEVQADEISDYALYDGDKRVAGYVTTAVMLKRTGQKLPD